MADRLAGYHPNAVLLVRAFDRPLRRASMVGLIAGILAGAVVMYGLSRTPWPVAAAAAILATVGIGFAVTLLLLPTKVRRAFDVYGWLAAREAERFKARTGASTAGSAAEVAAWLDANPKGPVTGLARVEMLLSLGRIEEGRSELAALGPGRNDVERLELAGLRAFAETLETGAYDEGAYEAAVATFAPGSDLATEAAVARALLDSRSRLALGRPDPLGPLAAVRPLLGREPTLVALRRTWRSFVRSLALFGVAIALFGFILRGGVYGLFP
jgi:hypothetical protein